MKPLYFITYVYEYNFQEFKIADFFNLDLKRSDYKEHILDVLTVYHCAGVKSHKNGFLPGTVLRVESISKL